MSQTFLQEKFIGTVDKVLQFDNNLELKAVNASISGIQPQILVSSNSGATITASCKGVVMTGVESSGKWEFNVPFTGIWTITGTLDSTTETTTVEVTVLKQYAVNLFLE